MKKNKIIVLSVFILLIGAFFLFSCSENANIGSDDGKYQIICTIFPEYDFINEIIGEKSDLFNVTILLDDGTDMHSYQPTVSQIAGITTCDLFCYIGGGSQNWINNILKNVDRDKVSLLCLADELKDELLCYDHEEGEEHHADHDHGVLDEHVWLSLSLAKKSVSEICNAICGIDPENKDYYLEQASNYISRLDGLDKEFSAALVNSKHDSVVVADRFPFVYLFRDYNIGYYAAFEGCSSESDAGVKTVLELSDKVRTLELDYIIVIENSNNSIANAVITESKREVGIITLNSCQSITAKEIADGANYIDIMKNNLEGIKKALGCN